MSSPDVVGQDAVSNITPGGGSTLAKTLTILILVLLLLVFVAGITALAVYLGGTGKTFLIYWRYVALMIVLWCPALSSSSSSASVTALR